MLTLKACNATFLFIPLRMETKFFNPYIGPHYQEGLINNKKVLVLGASHSCTYNSSSDSNSSPEEFKTCPVWHECTSTEYKDSSKFDMCCPYYQFLGWYDQFDYVKLSNSPRIELENYLSDEEYPAYDNFTQCLINLLKFPNKQYLWKRLAFVNYVQYFLPTITTPTLTRKDIRCFEALIEYVDQLKPNIIIAWGTKITNHFKHNYIKSLVEKLKVREDDYFWDFENKGHKCLIVNPYHPCDKKPGCYWSKNLDGFQSALVKALEIKITQ